jgi:hypothetical protein
MSVLIMLFMYRKPGEELNEGEEVTGAQLRDLGRDLSERLHAAADIVDKLTATGWSAQMALYDIFLSHPYVHTEVEARSRLDSLGIDPDSVFIDEFEDEDEGEPDFEDEEGE